MLQILPNRPRLPFMVVGFVAAALLLVLCLAAEVDAQSSSPSQWWCFGQGPSTALRLASNGEVECAGTDGRNCVWYASNSLCNASTPPSTSNLNPLQCGAKHQLYQGSSGYVDDHSWCLSGLIHLNPAVAAFVAKYLPRTAPVPPSTSEWRCIVQENYTPTRVATNGEIECMATDARNCAWKDNLADCNTLISNPVSPLQPLQCGAMHQGLFGESGYSVPGHWCMQALIDRKLVSREDLELYTNTSANSNSNSGIPDGSQTYPIFPAPSSGSSGSSNLTKILIIVGVVIGVLLIILIAVLIWRTKRNRVNSFNSTAHVRLAPELSAMPVELSSIPVVTAVPVRYRY